MAGESLDATLILDVSDARSIVDELASSVESSLGAAVDSFSTQFTEALSAVPPVEIDADASAVPGEVDDAIAQIAAATVDVEADASAIPGEVDDALAQIGDAAVAVDADTTEANAALQDLIAVAEGTDVTIGVDADTTDAQGAVDDLAASSQNLGSSASSGAAGVNSEVEATALLAGGAGLAKGEVGGLSEVAHGLGGTAAGAAVGVAAVGAATVEFFHAGVDATSAGQRFDAIVGDLADTVEHVHVGDLSTGLGELGLKFGSTDAEMKNAIASLFQFGVNGGKTREESAGFSNEIAGLAARAVSLTPSLGNLSDVTESLGTRIARGGRFAAVYGLSLTSAEINAKALSETNKESASDLTIQEKAFAAAEIAAERYGNGLKDTVANGAKNAANEQKSFEAVLRESIETLGIPIVVPIFDIIRAGLPVIADLGKVLSTLVQAALPAVKAGVEVIGPPLHVLADILDLLGPAIGPVIDGFLLFKVVEFIPTILTLLSGSLFVVADAAPLAGAAMEAAALETATAAATVEASLGPIGLLVAGLTIAAAAFGLFGGSEDEGAKHAKDLTDALIESNGALDDHVAKVQRAALESEHQVDDLNRAGVSFKQWQTAVESASGATAAQQRAIQNLAVETVTGDATNAQFVATLRGISPELGKVADQLDKNGELNKGLKITLLEQIGATVKATEVTKDRTKAGADDASITKQQTDQTVALASALPDLETGEAAVTSAHQGNVIALTDVVAAVSRYQNGALSLADTTAIVKSAQDAMTDAVIQGQFAYAAGAQAALVEKAAIDETAASLIAALTPLTDVASGTRAYNAELAAGQTANANAVDALGRYKDGTLSAKEATDALTLSDQALRAELDLLLGRFLSQQQAAISYDGAIANVYGTILKNGTAIGNQSAEAEANASALLSAGQSAISWSESIANAGGTAQAQIVPLQLYRDKLQTIRDSMAEVGSDTSFVDGLIANTDGAIAGLTARIPVFNAAGVQIGTATKTGAADGSSELSNVVLTNTQAAADAVGGKVPVFDDKGNQVGSALASGAGVGASGTSPAVTGEVDRAANDAALAGANMHNIGYGIGAAFSAGIGDGIFANKEYISANLNDALHYAVVHAHGSGPPYEAGRDVIGVPLGRGIADGIAVALGAVDLGALLHSAVPAAPAVRGTAPTLGGYGVLAQVAAQQAAARGGGTETVTHVDRSLHQTIDARGVESPEELMRSAQQRQVALQYLIGPS